jgi:DNA-binding NtrC family response regulator
MTAILVAEDDPFICDLLTDVLRDELAATVRCEPTGSLALQAIETAGFDLAIIDVNLPEVSGYELAWHAANRNIAVLLSSGHPESDTKLKAYECPFLPKPFLIADLLDAAAEAITHADETIRRVKVSLIKLATTSDGLEGDVAKSRRLMRDIKAVPGGRL